MNDDQHHHPDAAAPASTPEPEIDEERRQTLKALGVFAVYTTPAVTTLLVSQRATAQSVLDQPPAPPP